MELDSQKKRVASPTTVDGTDITTTQRMFSGVLGSCLISILGTPLDVARVRLQSLQILSPSTRLPMFAFSAQPQPSLKMIDLAYGDSAQCLSRQGSASDVNLFNGKTACSSARTPPGYPVTSTLGVLRSAAYNEGLLSLWRGLSLSLIIAVPSNIVYLTSYDWLRYSQKTPLSNLSGISSSLIAGSLARGLAVTIVGPIELTRTIMQANASSSTGRPLAQAIHNVRFLVSSQGYSAIFKGLTMTLWRDIPFSAIYWCGYELMRRKNSNTPSNNFLSGAVSGAFASIVTMPFDVAKTRIQTIHHQTLRTRTGTALASPSIARMLLLIWNNEGVLGLWRGCLPRVLKTAPACAIMISSYEACKDAFYRLNQQEKEDDARRRILNPS